MPRGIVSEAPLARENCTASAADKDATTAGAVSGNTEKSIATSPVQMDSSSAREGKEEQETTRETSNLQADEGIEVVLEDSGSSCAVVETHTPERQSIFRHPQAVRPPMRGPPPPMPPHHAAPYGSSGSWGYHPAYGDYPPPPPPPPPPRPYATPAHNQSASFEEHTHHYSPHVQYPPYRGYAAEDVNVISPNHKEDPRYGARERGGPSSSSRREPGSNTPTSSAARTGAGYYQYPPTSPVSRPSAPPSSGPPRLRQYASMRRSAAAAAAGEQPHWQHPRPPVVADSFDSEPRDPYMYGWGAASFDSGAPPPPPPMEDPRYYGYPPDSPYSQSASYAPPYSPGGVRMAESFSYPPQATASFTYSYDEDFMQQPPHDPYAPVDGAMHSPHHPHSGQYQGQRHYHHPNSPKQVTPQTSRNKNATPVASNTTADRDSLLPEAAQEIDFPVAEPPMEPVTPPSDQAIYESIADVNGYDVLCGRGGGTNSQIGNRRFRQLVQDFQPTYLVAKRKEKPLLARTIVLIIRKRGGHFLKKNEDTGELLEVGDVKAEAKTSQALREGLDVRATRADPNKKKKKKSPKSPHTPISHESPVASRTPIRSATTTPTSRMETSPTVSPLHSNRMRTTAATTTPPRQLQPPSSTSSTRGGAPTIPALHTTGVVHPHSPENASVRKRRRVRATDRFFPDFEPPRASLARPALADQDDDEDDRMHDDDDVVERAGCMPTYEHESVPVKGCAGIAMDLVTGAATGSFCLGPTGWRR